MPASKSKASKSDKNDKVFDVAKPGKAAASASSRPLIIGHKSILKDPMVKEEAVDEMEVDKTIKIDKLVADSDKPSGSPPIPTPEEVEEKAKFTSKAKAPSESTIVIKPLSESKASKSTTKVKTSDDDTKIAVKVKSKTPEKAAETVVAAQAVSDAAVTTEESKDDTKVEDTATEEPDAVTSDSESTDTDSSENTESESSEPSESTESEEEKPTEDNEDKTDKTETSDDANADSSASIAAQKKAEIADQQAEAKKAEIEKLVNSKQFNIQIGEKTRKRRSLKHVLLGALLILLLGGALVYLMIDVGIIKSDVKLPFEFFKDNSVSTTDATTPSISPTTQKTATKTQPKEYKVTTTVPSTWKKYTDEATKLTFYIPDNWNDVAMTKVNVTKNMEPVTGFSKDAKVVYEYSLTTKAVRQMKSAAIFVFDQTMSKSVDQLKKSIVDPDLYASADEIPEVKVENITFNGKKAVIVQTIQGKVTTKHIFVEANGYTYAMVDISSDNNYYKANGTTAKEVLTVYESVKID